jgi:hypothetical protein
MKYFIFCFFIFLIACKERSIRATVVIANPQPADSVLIRLMGGDQAQVDSCVYVSWSLESDTGYRSLLAKYICHNLYSNDTSIDSVSLEKLTSRKSFYQMILLFYDNSSNFDKISYYDDKKRLPELRENLLFGIGHCCNDQLSMIADTLLKEGNFDGLKVLWEKADLQKLPALKDYLTKVDTGNFFVYANLAAFFHNNGNWGSRDTFLNKARKIKKFREQFYSLDTLIAHNKQFDFMTYSELIYGGM